MNDGRALNFLDDVSYFDCIDIGYLDVIVDDPFAQDGSGAREENEMSFCLTNKRTISYNLFIMRRRLEYLRAWLDPSLSQRIAFMAHSAPSMSLEGELYEIANLRQDKRGTNGWTFIFIHAVLMSSLDYNSGLLAGI